MRFLPKESKGKMICAQNIMTLIMILMLIVVNVGEVFAATSITNLRYSNTAETTRIVVDISGTASYSDNTAGNKIIVDIEGAVTNVREVSIKDKIVSDISLKNINATKAQLIVELTQNVEYKIFTLKSPNRIVIDIYKNRPQTAKQSDKVPGNTTKIPPTTELEPVAEVQPPVSRQTVKKIAEGVTYTLWEEQTPIGPIVLHELMVSPQKYRLQLDLAEEQIIGREKASVILQDALAGINASYFTKEGIIIGNAIYEGEIVSSETLARTTLGIMADGSLKIAPSVYTGTVIAQDKRLMISAVNRTRMTDELVLFNEYYGPNTGTNEFGLEIRIENDRVTEINPSGNSSLRPDEYVLSAHGIMRDALLNVKVGDVIKIEQSMGKEFTDARFAQGAGPLLIKDGLINVTSVEEGFPKDIAIGRAPRTALGITAEKDIILLVVDGRSTLSKGVTLMELAGYLKEMGAVEAMNFDGGGSSEMVINRAVMNYPSDNGKERMISSTIGVYTK